LAVPNNISLFVFVSGVGLLILYNRIGPCIGGFGVALWPVNSLEALPKFAFGLPTL